MRIDVRKTKYWNVERMKEEKKMIKKQRTPPPSLEGREEAVTKILDRRAIEEKVPRARRDGEKTNNWCGRIDWTQRIFSQVTSPRKGIGLKRKLGPWRLQQQTKNRQFDHSIRELYS